MNVSATATRQAAAGVRRAGISALFAALATLALPAAAQTAAVRVAAPYVLNRDVNRGDHYMGVQFQGVLKLDPARIDGHTIAGLSALAFDRDEQLLYALSDRGIVFSLVLEHDEDGFLAGLAIPRAVSLHDAGGRPLSGRRADSEGLTLRNAANGTRGDTELVVSFERLPRVLRFDLDGRLRGSIALPARLRDRSLYQTGNRGLESLAWHPRLGYLTAVEQPFKEVTDGTVELHALDAQRYWRYPLAAEPNAGLAEVLALEDGSLLTLERGFGVFFIPFISTLRRIPALPDENGATLSVETVARFNTGQGWALDNFEGLAEIGGNRIVMVSDDNGRALQSTLLAQFRLLPASSSATAADTLDGNEDPAPASAIQ